ncbi:MAG: Asp-tRNA(Asn)/Glu-tRNA(Gln) amidotransferase subunit GatC [Cyclobacteriaceae bacterium]|jgi:aspartyl-tRNA(Asn)/glutamyl-tRNA(Gln) amidotransferase subunit C
MKVDKETLKKIAHLARLDLDERKEKEMLQSLSEILTWVEKLNELNTDKIDPLTNMSMEVNVLREDKIGEHLDREKGLLNAPERDATFFKVPKVKD